MSRNCDICGSLAQGATELDLSGHCGKPWGPDLQPVRYDVCRDCREDVHTLFSQQHHEVFL